MGTYEVVKRLSNSALAERYYARIQASNRTVVIHRLHPELAADAELVRTLIAEAQAVCNLRHPDIIALLEVGQSADGLFLVTEYRRGRNLATVLAQAIKKNVQLPLPVVAHIAATVCGALHEVHMHSNDEGVPLGLVHADLSLRQVLLDYEGRCWLRGQGTGRAAQLGARVTPDRFDDTYWSPERCRDEDIDPRSDVFSASIMFHELACGRRLFDLPSNAEARIAILSDQIPKPRDIRPEIPEALEALILRGLAFNRRERFVTAKDLQLAVESLIRNEGWKVDSKIRDVLVQLFGGPKPPTLPTQIVNPPLGTQGLASVESHGYGFTPSASPPQPPQPPPQQPAPTAQESAPPPDAPAQAAVFPPAPTAPAQPVDRRRQLLIGSIGATLLVLGIVILLALLPSSEGEPRVLLTVNSEPTGATVFVDGDRLKGVTPLGSELLPGKHHVVVMADEHKNWQQNITLKKGVGRHVLTAKLSRKATAGQAHLIIIAPLVAKVYLDGSFKGSGEEQFDVKPGVPHTLVVTQDGFLDRTIELELRAGETKKLTIELEPRPVEKRVRKRRRKGPIKFRRHKGRTLGGNHGEALPPQMGK